MTVGEREGRTECEKVRTTRAHTEERDCEGTRVAVSSPCEVTRPGARVLAPQRRSCPR